MRKRLFAMATLTMLVAMACGGGTASQAPAGTTPAGTTPAASTPAGSASAGGCLVGVSWNNYTQERWPKADEPNIKAAVEAGGGSYTRTDAKDNSEQQLADVDNLIAQGAKVLIILAKDAEAIKPAVAKAKSAGIPVIGYDRLVEDPDVFYITFDNKRVGTIIAQEVMKAAPSGNYVIIKGDPGDANAEFLRSGMTEAGIPALNETNAAGIKVVFEQNTANWDTAGARTNMDAALAATSNDVDAVLSENDGMATGVVQALDAVGLKVPVGGQDGDKAALNRVALGTQTVDVWKDARLLGKSAGEAAVALCANPDTSKVAGAAAFTTPGGNSVNSIFLTPQAITKDNLNVVLDAGWITKADLCLNVTAGSVGGC